MLLDWSNALHEKLRSRNSSGQSYDVCLPRPSFHPFVLCKVSSDYQSQLGAGVVNIIDQDDGEDGSHRE